MHDIISLQNRLTEACTTNRDAIEMITRLHLELFNARRTIEQLTEAGELMRSAIEVHHTPKWTQFAVDRWKQATGE
jgi:hypothetical protein